jgi:hypothetical protein
VATKEQIDKILEMREKGSLTQEQADELIEALSGESPDARTGKGSESGQRDEKGGPGKDDSGAEDWEGPWESRQDRRERRWQKRYFGGFVDPQWVDEVVDKVTSGIGKALEWIDPDTGYYGNHHHGGDERRSDGARSWHNAQTLSRVEQPEGEDFQFNDNRATYSKLRSLRLTRSRMNSNAFSASTVIDVEMADSVMEDTSLAGASLNELRMTGDEGRQDRGLQAHARGIAREIEIQGPAHRRLHFHGADPHGGQPDRKRAFHGHEPYESKPFGKIPH